MMINRKTRRAIAAVVAGSGLVIPTQAKLWTPAKPAIVRAESLHDIDKAAAKALLPGFCLPMAVAAGAPANPNPFGTLLFVGSEVISDITDPFVVDSFTGGVEAPFDVYVGDLIIAAFGEQTDLTVTAVTDNLGNTYTASNAGTDAGGVSGRMFYSRVTQAGTVEAINFDTAAGGNNCTGIVAAFAGPFSAASLVDANPANNTDSTSPHNCPATGTRAQAIELVVSWGFSDANGGSNEVLNAMTTGTLARRQSGSQGEAEGAVGYTVTVNTNSITHVFTSTDSPGNTVLGTTSFRNG